MHIVNDFVWTAHDTGQAEEFEDEWLQLLYKHPDKQYAFLRNSPLSDQFSKRGLAIMEGVFKGALEAKKHNAVYVGLSRNKGKVDKLGKVKHPYQVKKEITKQQITKINDYLLVTGLGIRFGQFTLDNEEVEAVLKNKQFLKANYANWSTMSRKARIRIRTVQNYFHEKIIPV